MSLALAAKLAAARGLPVAAAKRAPSLTLTSWERLKEYAGNQSLINPPQRAAAAERTYTQYKQWLSTLQPPLTNAGYVLNTCLWNEERRVAFEPCMVPYALDAGIEHWVLWFHPDAHAAVPAGQDTVWEILADYCPTYDWGNTRLPPDSGGGRDSKSAMFYQNIPEFRSIPSVPHLHVFLRTHRQSAATRAHLQQMRSAWEARSSFLASLPIATD